jgi:co-chaperonin GroES (HSP10)
MIEKVIPLGHKVLVKQVEAAETYGDTGIYIPDNQKTQKHKGTVVSVGEVVQGIQEGDVVQYNEHAKPVIMKHDGEDHLLIDQHDILAIIVSV